MRGTCRGVPTYLEEVYNTRRLGAPTYPEEVCNGGTVTYLLWKKNATALQLSPPKSKLPFAVGANPARENVVAAGFHRYPNTAG